MHSGAPIPVYMLPGLGADARLFLRFKLPDPYRVIPITWPHCPASTSLTAMAHMLHHAVKPTGTYIIGGVSLGGMVAQEWAHVASPAALLLISTLQHRSEWPWWLLLSANADLGKRLRKKHWMILARMGDALTRKSPEGRALFYEMLRDQPADVLEWGARKALQWQPPPPAPVTTLRLHGTTDALFPYSRMRDARPVRGANHFMIYERGSELAIVITHWLNTLSTHVSPS